jgi:signal transduction histidine kinase
VLILLVAGAGGFWAPIVSAAPTDQKSVLILLPGQPGLPAASALAAGARSVLVSAWSTRITIETEHVDVARFKGTGYERHLREVYRQKYAERPFDAIVVAAHEPLGFLLRARGEIWPDTPVVVCAVDERTPIGPALPPGFTVITVRYDIEGTLRAAIGLLPETRHVALIGGVSPHEQSFHEVARQAVRAFGDRLDVIDLTGLSLDELLRRVSALPERTIALASSFQVDAAGRRFYGVEIVGPISAAANRPLFSVFGTVLGRGIVGGSLVDFEAVGREAGELALRVLRGEPMPAGPVRSAASSMPLFDWRELRRWELEEGKLPAGSSVLFRRPTAWEQYRWQIVSTAALIAVQSALIVGLLAERRRRRRAQEGLAERLRFETLVADISATFASLPPARVDEHIRECLRRIVLFLGVDRGTLWQPSTDGGTLLATHAWTAEGEEPPPATLAIAAYPLLWKLGERDQSLCIDDLGGLPPEAVAERRALARLGVKSLVAVPLRIGERMLGVLAFVSLRGRRPWPPELVQGLRTLGELFANALVRKQAATALETSQALTSAVLTALPGETAIIDAHGVIVQVNEAWAALAAANSAESRAAMAVGGSYLDACRRGIATSAESASRALDLVESVLQGRRKEGVLEYSACRDQEDRWFELRAERLTRSEGGAAIMHFDITARKRAQAEASRHLEAIAHLDRVAALGELASSLAHELNQPLTAILANAQAAHRFLAAAPADLEELRECLEDIMSNDRRAGEVIRRMRQLLKQGTTERAPLQLDGLVQNVVALVSNDALLHQVSIEIVPAPALPVVYGDDVQIQQVILNLLSNAVAAAATGPPADRRVTVQTAAGEGHVELSVRDSGKGIAESDLERIFEPFFTTKQEGLGMGLTISRSIVEAHGGRIWAENDPAGGAILCMRLPVQAA